MSYFPGNYRLDERDHRSPPKAMLDWLLSIDVSLYSFVNSSLANPVFDSIMPIITNVRWWMPVYVIGLLLLFWKGGQRGRICTLLLLSCVAITDSFNSRVLKEMVGRERPSTTLSTARVIAPAAGGKSFPSSHATNNFGAALILSLLYGKRRALWYACAITVAFSRVYVGVHYPLDVAAGAVEGSLIAWMLWGLQQRFWPLDEVES